MKEIAYYNGRFVAPDEPAVSLNDRGYYFGDGVYEVTRVYNGRPFALSYHLDRLYRSMRELRIPVRIAPDELSEMHEVMVEQSEIQDGYIYMQISRDVSTRHFPFPKQVNPPLSMVIRAIDEPVETLNANGVTAITIPDDRWARCDIKCLNLLPAVLGTEQAEENNAYEAIQIKDGIITEGCSSNIVVIKNGIVYTHPADKHILKGITRVLLFSKVAPTCGVTVIEKKFDKEFMNASQEVFLSNTVTGLTPIIAIDGNAVGTGKVGAVTQKLQAAYRKILEEGLP